jgi:hypothetical protein
MGEGLKTISQAINGIQRGRIYTVGAAPKGLSKNCIFIAVIV